MVLALAATARLPAGDDITYELPKLVTYSTQVANQTPVATFAMPVSGLRFEPRVDVQARNLAEGQADIAIRGGVFENTGFKLGAAALYDPQTGHYFAEIPVAPAMLLSPQVLTGADNAASGFNAGVGAVAYGWRPIAPRGEAAVAFGNYATNRQSLYQGLVLPGARGGPTLAADFELSRSESDGSVPFGDHDFRRASGRLQLQGAQSQTDFFAGVQQKFFGWPNLYTPFGFNETEDLRTILYAFNHRAWTSPDSHWQLGAYYRRNDDDYEFNRAVPGASNPFVHATHVRALALDGHQGFGDYAVTYGFQAMRDSLQSTALTSGRFRTRDYYKATLVPEREFVTTAGRVRLRAGATYDDTNREAAALSPLAEVRLTRPNGRRLYAQYSEATQVATYTALNSNAAAGLFRGNPNLGRATSRNLEAGFSFSPAGWAVEAAVFHRRDDELTDWTFTRGVTARTANPVDIATLGVEVVATRRTPRYDLVLGYTMLDKDADYGAATIDASFYTLNFARHRLTAAVTARLGRGFEVRVDNEFRLQEANFLRVVGGDKAVLTSLGIYYLPPGVRSLEFSALVENLWDDDFQEVPAVPAAGRQIAFGAAYRW
ncbi:MAG: TonB-dependent receptor [Opitutaceae bacterium]|nr:TonB-dependent receptor [Opitutaceae bacterium]